MARSNHIYGFICMLATLLCTWLPVQAQFAIYTDVVPDSPIPITNIDTSYFGISKYGETVIDLNLDGKPDFVLVDDSYNGFDFDDSSSDTYISLPDSVTVGFYQIDDAIEYGCGYRWATGYQLGDIITQDSSFSGGAHLLRGYTSGIWGMDCGFWNPPTSVSAIGVRIKLDGDWQYGWIDYNGLLNNYAINPLKNQQIVAGLPFDSTFASPVHSITAEVLNSNGDFSAIRLKFNVPLDEAGISEYRILAVKKDSLPTFTLTKALALSSGNYQSVVPTGINFDAPLSATLLDANGDTYQFGQQYHFLVLSMADGIDATQDNLWSCSPYVNAQPPLAMASSPILTEVGDHNDARDFEISFSKATDETGILAYRVFLVEEDDDPATISTTLAANRYLSLMPNGADQLATFPTTQLDVMGDSVRAFKNYRAFVLSVADGVLLPGDALSEGSNYLATNLDSLLPANLTVTDSSNFGDGRDIGFTFDPAVNETNVLGYRVYVTTESTVPVLDSILAIPSSAYVFVPKTTGGYSGNLGSATDITGLPISGTGTYRIFTLTVGDNLSFITGAPSGETSEPLLLSAVELVAEISDFEFTDVYPIASSLEISFDKAADETEIAEYRIVLFKRALFDSLDVTTIAALPANRYFSVTPSGGPYVLNLPAAMLDIDGDSLRILQAYVAQVWSVPDSSQALMWVASAPSVSDQLNQFDYWPQSPLVLDIEDLGDWQDFQFTFNAANGELIVDEYRAFASKSILDSTAVLALSPSQFQAIVPNGSSSYEVDFSALMTDVDGEMLSGNDSLYYFHCASIFDGRAFVSVNAFRADHDPLKATELSLLQVEEFGDARDLVLTFESAEKDPRIEAYRIILVETSNLPALDIEAVSIAGPSKFIEIPGPIVSLSTTFEDFPSTMTEFVNGDPVQAGRTYQAIVWSKTTPGTNSIEVFSKRSNPLTIVEPTSTGLEEVHYQLRDWFLYLENYLLVQASIDKASVIDLSGKVVIQSSDILPGQRLDLSALTEGVYLVEVISADEIFAFKLFHR